MGRGGGVTVVRDDNEARLGLVDPGASGLLQLFEELEKGSHLAGCYHECEVICKGLGSHTRGASIWVDELLKSAQPGVKEGCVPDAGTLNTTLSDAQARVLDRELLQSPIV